MAPESDRNSQSVSLGFFRPARLAASGTLFLRHKKGFRRRLVVEQEKAVFTNFTSGEWVKAGGDAVDEVTVGDETGESA